MPFYAFDLTVPPSTPESAPVELEAEFPPGLIQQVDVQFPSGCVGLVHTFCRRGANQVWPTNPEGDFASSGMAITWPDRYELGAAPFSLRLFAWNDDDTYDHTITWRFALLPFTGPRREEIAAAAAAQGVQVLEIP